MDGIFSVKSDVFSFGVLVLEIVSGKKNRGIYSTEPQLNLLGHVSIAKEKHLSLNLHHKAIVFLPKKKGGERKNKKKNPLFVR